MDRSLPSLVDDLVSSLRDNTSNRVYRQDLVRTLLSNLKLPHGKTSKLHLLLLRNSNAVPCTGNPVDEFVGCLVELLTIQEDIVQNGGMDSSSQMKEVVMDVLVCLAGHERFRAAMFCHLRVLLNYILEKLRNYIEKTNAAERDFENSGKSSNDTVDTDAGIKYVTFLYLLSHLNFDVTKILESPGAHDLLLALLHIISNEGDRKDVTTDLTWKSLLAYTRILSQSETELQRMKKYVCEDKNGRRLLRKLIALVDSEPQVIIGSLSVMGLLVLEETAGGKFFSRANIHRTLKLVFNILNNGSTPSNGLLESALRLCRLMLKNVEFQEELATFVRTPLTLRNLTMLVGYEPDDVGSGIMDLVGALLEFNIEVPKIIDLVLETHLLDKAESWIKEWDVDYGSGGEDQLNQEGEFASEEEVSSPADPCLSQLESACAFMELFIAKAGRDHNVVRMLPYTLSTFLADMASGKMEKDKDWVSNECTCLIRLYKRLRCLSKQATTNAPLPILQPNKEVEDADQYLVYMRRFEEELELVKREVKTKEQRLSDTVAIYEKKIATLDSSRLQISNQFQSALSKISSLQQAHEEMGAKFKAERDVNIELRKELETTKSNLSNLQSLLEQSKKHSDSQEKSLLRYQGTVKEQATTIEKLEEEHDKIRKLGVLMDQLGLCQRGTRRMKKGNDDNHEFSVEDESELATAKPYIDKDASAPRGRGTDASRRFTDTETRLPNRAETEKRRALRTRAKNIVLGEDTESEMEETVNHLELNQPYQ